MQASLATKNDDGTARCDACQWRCVLAPAALGICQVRRGSDEGIEAENYALISAAAVGPIEDHRLWHFFPNSLALSVGSWGYSFPADQTRGLYAHIPAEEGRRRRLDPDRVATFALERLCRGVIWAYGDPAVAAEYVCDVLKLSRASSRYTAMITNGFLTSETLDTFGPYLDGISLELRAFDDASYARLTGVKEWRGILDVAARARQKWNCHMEVTTRLHHGVNSSPDELRALVTWLRDTLGPDTPWHVLPGDAGSESAAAVVRARRLGLEEGLQFVYGPEPAQPTRCPSCGHELISRDGGATRVVGISDGSCTSCGTKVNVRASIFGRRRSNDR
jgi:pyruvate formate lyase activating enzyme